MVYKEISKCRICGNTNLISVLNLGNMALTGVFPKNKTDKVESGPMELVKCDDSAGDGNCGLLQLKHNYNLDLLYGQDYGYRSGLNASMVSHLQNKVKKILGMVELSDGDLIIDIGGNDSTLLQAYPTSGLNLVVVDPTGVKFKEYYPDHIDLIPEFFPSKTLTAKNGDKKAKAITSIAMFYDLEDPTSFVKNIAKRLDKDGIWVFEQSYMPTMLDRLAYDTVCHEHLEYYSLKQIKYMLDKAGLKIIDIEFNDINGGSFSVYAAQKESKHKECTKLIEKILADEKKRGLHQTKVFKDFEQRITKHRDKLKAFINKANKEGKKILGYGASTKGNVLLQYCGITEKDIPFIAEVNERKFGCFTPGTLIPIISEKEAKKLNPDHFMVLPWHFKDNIVAREQDFLAAGHSLFFPLPDLLLVETQPAKTGAKG